VADSPAEINPPRPYARTGLYASPQGVKASKAYALRQEKVRRLVRELYAALPWLRESDKPAVRSWADLELTCAELAFWLSSLGLVNGQGEPRRLVTELRQFRAQKLQYETALGMTPLSRAQLEQAAQPTADTIDVTESAAARVIEVARSRGKTTDEGDDGAK